MYRKKRGTILFVIGFLFFFLGIAVVLSVWQENDECEFVSHRSENVEECQVAGFMTGIGFFGVFSGIILFSLGGLMTGIGEYRGTRAETSCPRCGMRIRDRLHVRNCPKCGMRVSRLERRDLEWQE
jgi:hypothetical protein